ncbi:MAG: hypothetical protein U0269_22620 [Polyangiales bacterium]
MLARSSALLVGALFTVACASPSPSPDASRDDVASMPDASSADAVVSDVVASDVGTVSCGSTSCGANEYCEDRCTCCGIAPPPDSGLQPSSQRTCRPIPAGCSAADLCSCSDLRGAGICDSPRRTVMIPCA